MALQQFPLENTFIVAAWLETCLYGITPPKPFQRSQRDIQAFISRCFGLVFMFTIGGHARAIGHKTLQARVEFASSILMFAVATAHVAMSCYRMIRGYVDFGNAPGGPVSFLGVISHWTHIFNDVLFTIQSLLGDAMAVYRCWVLWDRDYKFLILPLALLIVNFVSGCKVTTGFARVRPGGSIFDSSLSTWITIFFSVAVVQNIITTGLMALRLWLTERKSPRFRMDGGAFLPVIRILVESAALYLFLEILLLVFYSLSYNVQYIVLDAMTPTIGITFGMITVRVMLRSQKHSSQERVETIGSVVMRRIVVSITAETEEDGPGVKMENEGGPANMG
ncbi:hypothetical protein B0H16DRAFT_1474396 [Mycena metata]|uniref:Uncharacterized protein n=1 Tax=Mycena metata TaxID=1033252 RepID=A0AAD7HHU0_9AGAR|nr:hypothetical protein B0H16DRAFT_1474396 [Mycena metata]